MGRLAAVDGRWRQCTEHLLRNCFKSFRRIPSDRESIAMMWGAGRVFISGENAKKSRRGGRTSWTRSRRCEKVIVGEVPQCMLETESAATCALGVKLSPERLIFE